jgi:hypothetical protein
MPYSHLTSQERYVISHLVLYGLSLREPRRADPLAEWYGAGGKRLPATRLCKIISVHLSQERCAIFFSWFSGYGHRKL